MIDWIISGDNRVHFSAAILSPQLFNQSLRIKFIIVLLF